MRSLDTTTRRMRKGDDGKRHRVVLRDGVEGYLVTTTALCSGCTGPNGCEECGYSGKRRFTHWAPFSIAEWQHREQDRANAAIRTRAFYRHQGVGQIVQVVSIHRTKDRIVVAFYGGGIGIKSLTQFARDYVRISRAEVESVAARLEEEGVSCSSS